MRRLAYIQPNGIVAIVHPVLNADEAKAGFTEKDAEERSYARLVAKHIAAVWIDEADIPKDRSKRNEWSLSHGKLNTK